MAPAYDPDDVQVVRSVVCMADILGYTRMITDNPNRRDANAILHRLNDALSAAYDELRKWGADTSLFDMRTFTDNVVVGCPVRWEEDAEGEIGLVLMAFAAHEASLAAEGFFMRGGIAVGDLYMNPTVVFGLGLHEAHRTDSHGQPPRLLLAGSALALASGHLGYYSPGASPHESYLASGDDGVVFLNYLYAAFQHFPDGGFDHDLLRNHRDRVLAALKEHGSEPDTYAKYRWVAEYHNWAVQTFADSWKRVNPETTDGETGATAAEAQRAVDYLIPGIESGMFTAFGT